MPVTDKEFDAGSPVEKKKGVNKPKIIAALKATLPNALSINEIAEKCDVNKATVSQYVRDLEEEGTVARKSVKGRIHIKYTGE